MSNTNEIWVEPDISEDEPRPIEGRSIKQEDFEHLDQNNWAVKVGKRVAKWKEIKDV